MTVASEIYASKRLNAIERFIREDRQKEWEEKEAARRAREEERKKMYVLRWGLHRGTLMSRDIGDNFYFNNLEECRKKHMELKADFNSRGYQIWYAEIVVPYDGEKIKLEDNAYY
jgi:hypothetical protein